MFARETEVEGGELALVLREKLIQRQMLRLPQLW